MRYLTHYEQYPIYEPAEGGYYYAGNEPADYWELSKRAAKRTLMEIYNELVAENMPDRNGYPKIWISIDKNAVYKVNSGYIGDAESWIIERSFGSERKGWTPYC